MARTISITKQNLLDAAISLVKREGAEALTARKLASEAHCSTQPIFRVYSNMDELNEEVFGLVMEMFSDHCEAYPKTSSVPFVDLGLAYISYAQENKELFRLLFLSEKRYGNSLMGMLNGKTGFLKTQISAAVSSGCKDPEGLFMKMWIMIHGSACMALTGDYDLDSASTQKLLEDAEKVFA